MYAATSTYLSQLIDIPKLKGIIFAEFDADKGPVIRVQVPDVLFDAKRFVQSDSYARGRYIFNLCFVVDKNSQIDCIYEPMVQKCAAYLTQMEKDSGFLSQSQDQLPPILLKIFEGLNEHGECKVPVTDQTIIYLKLCSSFHGIEPPKVEPYMVPMFTRIPPPNTPDHLPKMDILSQKNIMA
ncbi:unnamed protein product [Gongylonema pulchrum]|uniref:UDENN domain-containing protein n=1 Tax=Gongylonema pulchrum TaxID=637853 RepID=A0A183E2G5_9BILA|nr:unnamed protein product [Gongylonema pulchrum]